MVFGNSSSYFTTQDVHLTWSDLLENRSTAPLLPEHQIVSFYPYYDVPFFLFWAVLLYNVRKFMTTWFFRPLASKWGLHKPNDVQRFTENAWFSVYYTLSSCFGLTVLSQCTWLYDIFYVSHGYPQEHLEHSPPLFREYYLIGGAFYSQALFTLVLVDERMKDFVEMLIHHLATIVLIVFSLATCNHRVGSLVLILHDIVDIFLYSAKLFHAIDKPIHQFLANALFMIFAATFLVLRLLYFPWVISWIFNPPLYKLNANMQYLFRYVPNVAYPFELTNYGTCAFRYCFSTYYVLGLLLCVLLVLHINWYRMILRILITTLTAGKNPGDIRHKEKGGKKGKEH